MNEIFLSEKNNAIYKLISDWLLNEFLESCAVFRNKREIDSNQNCVDQL